MRNKTLEINSTITNNIDLSIKIDEDFVGELTDPIEKRLSYIDENYRRVSADETNYTLFIKYMPFGDSDSRFLYAEMCRCEVEMLFAHFKNFVNADVTDINFNIFENSFIETSVKVWPAVIDAVRDDDVDSFMQLLSNNLVMDSSK